MKSHYNHAHNQDYMNDKRKADAFYVFVSRLNRNLTDFPATFAMTKEIELNHDRHVFAAKYVGPLEEKSLGIFFRACAIFSTKCEEKIRILLGNREVEKKEVDPSSKFR